MAMFKVGDNVMVSEGITPQGGQLLIADTVLDGKARRLFMDVRNEMIPDGQTAYLFGNKILVTVHWNDFSDEDKAQCESDIKFFAGLNYLGSGLFMGVKFGNYQWGNILVQPDLLWTFNDYKKGFDEIVFIFVDSNMGAVQSVRSFPIDGIFPSFFSYGNTMSYEYFAKSGKKQPQYTSVRTLFDDWSAASMSTRLWLLQEDPAELFAAEGVVTATMDQNNNVHWHMNE